MTLGERIKQQRQRCGMSQEKVAELVGVSRQAVAKWESGQSAPNTENLFKLADILGMKVDLLLDSGEQQSPAEQIYYLYKMEQEQKRLARQAAVRRNCRAAGLTAAGYLVLYLLGRVIWLDLSECSVMGWLLWAKPSGEHSYLYGWLLSSGLFWWAMGISILPALLGKFRFSAVTLVGFAVGLAAGILFGPYPEGAAYGHGHYGWAIWGGVFLLSIATGIVAEKIKRREENSGPA